jgi:hypothetical protein
MLKNREMRIQLTNVKELEDESAYSLYGSDVRQ